MGIWGSGDPTVNGKKIDPRIAGEFGGGGIVDPIVATGATPDPKIQSGWGLPDLGDMLKKAGDKASDVAEKAGGVAETAVKQAALRKYTLHGTLWDDAEGGGWKMLPTGYISAAAAAAIGLWVFSRK